MINMIQTTEKQKDMIKQGYVDMSKNIEKFLFLKSRNYDFTNINTKDITRVSKTGNFAIYRYNGIYFEVAIYNSGCYMSFDNIMGNWLSLPNNSGVELNKLMFSRYSNPKLAIKKYITGLVKFLDN